MEISKEVVGQKDGGKVSLGIPAETAVYSVQLVVLISCSCFAKSNV